MGAGGRAGTGGVCGEAVRLTLRVSDRRERQTTVNDTKDIRKPAPSGSIRPRVIARAGLLARRWKRLEGQKKSSIKKQDFERAELAIAARNRTAEELCNLLTSKRANDQAHPTAADGEGGAQKG